MRHLIIILTLSLLTACATIQSVGKVALDRAATISSALSLRNGYISTKDAVIAEMADTDRILFTVEEVDKLEAEAANIEAFYQEILDLSAGGTSTEILVKADSFLTSLVSVRASINAAIAILEPKAQQFSPATAQEFYRAVGNYKELSLKLDLALAQNDRQQSVDMAVKFLKATIPVVTGLLS